jgi:hypothetical protein
MNPFRDKAKMLWRLFRLFYFHENLRENDAKLMRSIFFKMTGTSLADKGDWQ